MLPPPINALAPPALHSLTGKTCPVENPTQKSEPDDATRVSLAPAGMSYNELAVGEVAAGGGNLSEVRCGEAPYVSPDAPSPHERSESTKDRAPEPLAARSAALTGLLYDVPASSSENARAASSNSGELPGC